MSRPAIFNKEVIERAVARAGQSTDLAQLRSAQAVILPACHGLTMDQTAAVLGISRTQLYLLQREARASEPQAARAPHGGRRRQTMTLEEEKAFLVPWTEEAVTAGMVIVPPLHEALEQKLGRKVHHSVVYRMLARHGWRKVAPDSIHPKADPLKQDDWKKNSRKWWPNNLPSPLPSEKGRA